MRESNPHNRETAREYYTANQQLVISLAWQNLIKRWVQQEDTSLSKLRQLLDSEIETDSKKDYTTADIPFLAGTTRTQDITEYEKFIHGTLTDLEHSYIVKQKLIGSNTTKGPRPGLHLSPDDEII